MIKLVFDNKLPQGPKSFLKSQRYQVNPFLIISNGKARPKWRHCTLYSYEKGVMGTGPKKKTALDISKRFDRSNCFHSCSMY